MIDYFADRLTRVLTAMPPHYALGAFMLTLLLYACVPLFACRGRYGRAAAAFFRLARADKKKSLDVQTFDTNLQRLPAALKDKIAAGDGDSAVAVLAELYRATLFRFSGFAAALFAVLLIPAFNAVLSGILLCSAAECAVCVLLFCGYALLLILLLQTYAALHFSLTLRRAHHAATLAVRTFQTPTVTHLVCDDAALFKQSGVDGGAAAVDDGQQEPVFTPYVFDGYRDGTVPYEDVIGRLNELSKCDSPMREMREIASRLNEARYQPENKTPFRKKSLDDAYKRLLDAVKDYAVK